MPFHISINSVQAILAGGATRGIHFLYFHRELQQLFFWGAYASHTLKMGAYGGGA
jgi:hypothetical protein